MLYDSAETVRQSRRKTLMAYLTLDQKVYVMQEAGDGALVLMEFYMSKVGRKGYLYEDKQVAKALGWSISKVTRLRLALTKIDCFKQVRMSTKDDVMLQTIIGERWLS